MKQTQPLSEQAEAQIIDYIMSNGLKEGSRLPNEAELSALLGVGRSTVREAVRLLVSRNVLDVRQGAGTFVAGGRIGVNADPLGFAFVEDKARLAQDLLEIRMMIEPRIAALAAQNATPEQIDEIKALCGGVEDLINADVNHLMKDIDFHTKIAESTGNIVVPNLLPIIQHTVQLFIQVTNRRLKRETIETHRAVTEAIANRDAVAASDAMTLHLIYNRAALRRIAAAQNNGR